MMSNARRAVLSRRVLLAASATLGALPAQALAPPRLTPSGLPLFTLEREPFPKLPAGRTLGAVTGLSVATDGHVWLLHMPHFYTPDVPDTPQERASRLPPVVELDADGVFIRAWGGPDHLPKVDEKSQWPTAEETLTIDSEGKLWIFGANKAYDNAVQRFTPDGELLLRIGRFGETGGDASETLLGGPTDGYFDEKSQEVFFSDGYGNHRVAAFDARTGKFTRAWGAYGLPPGAADARKGFANPVHAITRGPDGYLYVCDRLNNRVQVFDAVGRKDVRFVREIEVGAGTLGFGSTFNLTFEPTGRFIYLADGSNARIWVLDHADWKVLGWFNTEPNTGQRNIAQRFSTLHKLVVDSRGDLICARSCYGVERYRRQT
jgi:hypothetical protein